MKEEVSVEVLKTYIQVNFKKLDLDSFFTILTQSGVILIPNDQKLIHQGSLNCPNYILVTLGSVPSTAH